MRNIVKMTSDGMPSIVLPGVTMILSAPLAEGFRGLDQRLADEIDVGISIYRYCQDIAPEMSMRLDIENDTRDWEA